MWQWYLHWQSVSLVWYSCSACFYFKNTFPHWRLTQTLFISPRKYLRNISRSARLELDSVLEVYKRTMVLISVSNIIFTNQVMQSLSTKGKILWFTELYQWYLMSNQWVNLSRLKVLLKKTWHLERVFCAWVLVSRALFLSLKKKFGIQMKTWH